MAILKVLTDPGWKPIRASFTSLVFLFLSACSIVHSPRYGSLSPSDETQRMRKSVVIHAESLLGRRYIKVNGRSFPSDCSGYVAAVYYLNGMEINKNPSRQGENMVKTIYRYVEANGSIYINDAPKEGDIIFFSNTKRGNFKDLTHIGIVESVGKDGTISFIHKSSQGVVRDYLNLTHPSLHKYQEDDRVLNSYLRRKRPKDPPNTKYMTGELFEAFGNLIDPEKRGTPLETQEDNPGPP